MGKMTDELTPKERVLRLFDKKKIDRIPCFSGMGNVTIEGMRKLDMQFADAHKDADKMATLAASTYELYGFECAVVPFDLGIEAEALGCEMNFYEKSEATILYPTVKTKIAGFETPIDFPGKIEEKGRVPLVKRAIEMLKEDLLEGIAIGSYVLGPFTLAGQLLDLNDLLKNSYKRPDEVNAFLDSLEEVIVAIANTLKESGADYITIREMGAPADVISPRMFKSLVRPHLARTIGRIEPPTVLHICGNTNPIIEMMHECGPTAISVEQKNDVKATREKLGEDALIFGNIDPYNVIVKGTPNEIEQSVKEAIKNGVNAVWPGCDIWPEVPVENMKALVEATKKYGVIS
ncbi:MAG: MtaA/CmuA family methyltransferase [Candidatus Hydrothermarchaeales archaeon]